MKRKKIIGFLCVLAIIVCLSVILSACNLFGKKDDVDDSYLSTEYTLQYTDDNGAHTITVKHGQNYSLEEVPHKVGHNFLGLFDRRSGGTQFIDEYGDSIGAFTDDKDMTLYPQFEAITYRIVYNYGDEPIPDLWNDGFVVQQATFGERWSVETTKVFPSKNVFNLQNKTFDGWFTAAFGGEKIGDENGVALMEHQYVDEAIASVAGNDNVVCLYAHYANAKMVVDYSFPESFDIPQNKQTLASNRSDQWDFKTVFGYTLEELRALGFTTLSFDLELRLKEIDDGYQQIFLCRTDSVSNKNSLWKKDNIEHSHNKTDTTEWGHKFSGSVALDRCIETMGWYYCHSGAFSNAWRKCSLTVRFTLS